MYENLTSHETSTEGETSTSYEPSTEGRSSSYVMRSQFITLIIITLNICTHLQ